MLLSMSASEYLHEYVNIIMRGHWKVYSLTKCIGFLVLLYAITDLWANSNTLLRRQSAINKDLHDMKKMYFSALMEDNKMTWNQFDKSKPGKNKNPSIFQVLHIDTNGDQHKETNSDTGNILIPNE